MQKVSFVTHIDINEPGLLNRYTTHISGHLVTVDIYPPKVESFEGDQVISFGAGRSIELVLPLRPLSLLDLYKLGDFIKTIKAMERDG